MSDKQNEKKLESSTLTECNPCKFTFDVAPIDVKAARNAGDQDNNNTAVSDLPKVEIVDGRSERSLSQGQDNSSNARQPKEICANPDARDWSPLKCDEAAKESNQGLRDMTPPQSEKNLSGDVRDICKNPDAGDWAPAKCDTSAMLPRDMSEEELLSLPVDVALKHKDDQFKDQYYRQKRSERKEEFRNYDREQLTGEFAPNAKASSY